MWRPPLFQPRYACNFLKEWRCKAFHLSCMNYESYVWKTKFMLL